MGVIINVIKSKFISKWENYILAEFHMLQVNEEVPVYSWLINFQGMQF